MNFDSILDIRKYFVGQRRSYPFIFGFLFWIAWFVTSIMGPGNYDLSGNIIATDYLMGYTSGLTLSDGAVDQLFDYDAQLARQVHITGQDDVAAFSFNVPILQWIYVPFAQLPYLWSVVVWSFFGLGLLTLSLRLLDSQKLLPLALTFIPVYSNFTFGQNAFVSLLILTSVYVLWSKERKFLAGFVFALLLYKPQLVTGVGLLWLLNARRDWKALVGFAVGSAAMLGIMFGLMAEAMSDWLEFARNGLGDLAGYEDFPTYHMHNPRGFFTLLIPGLTDPLWLLTAAGGIGVFLYMWRNRSVDADGEINRPFWYAAAILLTMWATPHALVYDWTLLLLPSILLWKARPDWHDQLASLYIWGWLIYAISLPLTLAQQKISPYAVQLSVIFFGLALYAVTRLFLTTPQVPDTLNTSAAAMAEPSQATTQRSVST